MFYVLCVALYSVAVYAFVMLCVLQLGRNDFAVYCEFKSINQSNNHVVNVNKIVVIFSNKLPLYSYA